MINFTRKIFEHKFCKKFFTRKMVTKKNFKKIDFFLCANRESNPGHTVGNGVF